MGGYAITRRIQVQVLDAAGVYIGKECRYKSAMTPMEQKHKEILAYERQFAFKLAGHVMEKPKMNVWMILIPIIIVYHMFRFQKYVDGKKKFTSNYMKTREQALESARGIVAEGKAKDVNSITEQIPLSPEARGPYNHLLSVLVDHYVDLLRAEGDGIDALLRRAYRSRTDFLLFFNQLSQAEKRLNAALQPHMSREHREQKEIAAAISRIQEISEQMRRAEASRVFA